MGVVGVLVESSATRVAEPTTRAPGPTHDHVSNIVPRFQSSTKFPGLQHHIRLDRVPQSVKVAISHKCRLVSTYDMAILQCSLDDFVNCAIVYLNTWVRLASN